MAMGKRLGVLSRLCWITSNDYAGVDLPALMNRGNVLSFSGIKMANDFYTRLVYLRHNPVVGRMAYYLLKLLGVEIPREVKVGKGFELAHGGFGVVIHSKTKVGERVKVYPGVGLGRADIYLPIEQSRFEGIDVADDVILAPGAKVLCKEGLLRIGRGSVIGANAVLLEFTGEYEIWAGVPAQRVGLRPHGDMHKVQGIDPVEGSTGFDGS